MKDSEGQSSAGRLGECRRGGDEGGRVRGSGIGLLWNKQREWHSFLVVVVEGEGSSQPTPDRNPKKKPHAGFNFSHEENVGVWDLHKTLEYLSST